MIWLSYKWLLMSILLVGGALLLSGNSSFDRVSKSYLLGSVVLRRLYLQGVVKPAWMQLFIVRISSHSKRLHLQSTLDIRIFVMADPFHRLGHSNWWLLGRDHLSLLYLLPLLTVYVVSVGIGLLLRPVRRI